MFSREWIAVARQSFLVIAAVPLALSSAYGQRLTTTQVNGNSTKGRSEACTNVFENGQPNKFLNYRTAEDIGDGRGVTFGWFGATTCTGDGLQVVLEFNRRQPGNPLQRFTAQLQAIDNGTAPCNSLNEPAFIRAVHRSDDDRRFRRNFRASLEKINAMENFQPSQQLADSLGLQLAITRGQLYDAAIQHGTGGDSFSVQEIIRRTNAAVGTPSQAGEIRWINVFFDKRRQIIRTDPASDTTRVDIWQALVARGDLNHFDRPFDFPDSEFGPIHIP